jgi:hypothetical protein
VKIDARDIELSYWDFAYNKYPEKCRSKEAVIRMFEDGFAFDQFSEFLNISEAQLLEILS